MSLTVHIGFYKTGTTTLQESIFPKLKKNCFYGFKKSIMQFHELMFFDDLYYDEQKQINYFKKLADHQPTLFSQEALYGFIHFIGVTNRSQIARRLHNIGFSKNINICQKPSNCHQIYL